MLRFTRNDGVVTGNAMPTNVRSGTPEPDAHPTPAFILSCVRSGSTLLRCLLNAHPEICAPHELHLGYLDVVSRSEFTSQALSLLELSHGRLKRLLWDRVYEALLQQSGKRLLVDKSPSNLWVWPELAKNWPMAPVIILKRDPAAIARSIISADDERTPAEACNFVEQAIDALDQAAAGFAKIVQVRYEDLTAAPEQELARICAFLEVDYHRSMLDYLRDDVGPFAYGVGDWGPLIAGGTIVSDRNENVPMDIRVRMARYSERWGYQFR